MEFFDWANLGTLAGAVAAVAVITEITKELPGIRKIPTQIWSYALSLVVLVCAQAFTDGLNASGIVLSVFNAAMVGLAANGGYAALKRVMNSGADDNAEDK